MVLIFVAVAVPRAGIVVLFELYRTVYRTSKKHSNFYR